MIATKECAECGIELGFGHDQGAVLRSDGAIVCEACDYWTR